MLPPIPYTLTGVLGLLRIPRPDNLCFAIRGAQRTCGHSEGFIPKQAALITLTFSPEDEITPDDIATGLGHPEPYSGDDAAAPLGPHGPPHGRVAPSSNISTRRLLSPMVHVRSQTDTFAHLAHTPCGVAAEPVAVPASLTDSGHCSTHVGATRSDMWNCGSCQHALPMRHHGDTSIGVPDVLPASNSAAPCQVASGSADAASHDANPAGPVWDASVAAPAASSIPSAVDLDPAPSEDREEEGSDDDPSIDELSVEHPEWRLPVRVLYYQRAQTYHVLWVAQGESIDEVMIRAEVLLTPEGDLFCLQVPAFQPSRDCLTLLCYPRWWPARGIQAFIVADGHGPGHPYQEVIRPGQDCADVLRLHMQLAPPSVDTYVAGVAPAADTAATPPRLGDLFYQRAGLPAPSFATTADILADSSLDNREANLPQVGAPPGIGYLLLGAGDAQSFVDIRPGPSLPQIAEATGIDDLVYWVQIGKFVQPASQGVPVTRAIGYRDRRFLRDAVTPAIFIDARTLGKVLCCRILDSAF